MKKQLLTLTILLVSLTTFAQSNWNTYTTSNSDIGGNTILALACDAKNNLWVGTNLGLCRLSGRTWTDYAMFNEKLENQYVNCLTVDPNGILWIGTDDYGCIRFDGSRWTDYTADTKRLNMKFVRDIAINNDGKPWIGVTLSGLVDGTKQPWTKLTAASSSLLSDFILCLRFDRQGSLWIGTNDGLCILSPSGRWTSYTTTNSKLPANIVPSIAMAPDGSTWIGTISGLCHLGGQNWEVFTPKNSPLPGAQINALSFDAAGSLWIGTDKGIAVFDTHKNWHTYHAKKGQLPSNAIQRMVIDRKGNKWFGTDFDGLTRFSANGIRGRITDPQGHPMADIEVRCDNLTAQSDADGYYYIEIPVGTASTTIRPVIDDGTLQPTERAISNINGFIFAQDFTYSNVIASEAGKNGERITITPFLAEGYITIQLDAPEAEVEFIRADGQSIRTIPNYKNNAKITIAKMPKAQYTLRIKSAKGEKRLKFNLK